MRGGSAQRNVIIGVSGTALYAWTVGIPSDRCAVETGHDAVHIDAVVRTGSVGTNAAETGDDDTSANPQLAKGAEYHQKLGDKVKSQGAGVGGTEQIFAGIGAGSASHTVGCNGGQRGIQLGVVCIKVGFCRIGIMYWGQGFISFLCVQKINFSSVTF